MNPHSPSRLESFKEKAAAFLSASDCWILLAFLAFTLPFTLPVLDSFYTFDDLQNLWYYLGNPARALVSNLIVFTSYHRPAGALFYLPAYWVFGVSPLPLYVVGMILFYLNLGLFYLLVMRLTTSRLSAVLALLWFAFHPNNYNVLFNFGAIYELLTCTTLLSALMTYNRYLSRRAREEGGASLYWGVFIIYIVGLNAKETAVVLPLLLLCLEAVYRRPDRWKALARRLIPFFAVGFIYTCAKVLGPEAFWRSNPQYVFQFDSTFLFNLASYFSALSYWTIHFSVPSMLLTLAILVGLALILRDRHLIFGLLFFLTTLLPVLLLPRVWALFLYVPNCGVALYVGRLGCLTVESLGKAVRGYINPPGGKIVRLLTALAFLVLLRLALVQTAPAIRYARNASFFSKTHSWRSFCSQLFQEHPVLSEGARLGFQSPPFDFNTEDRWSLHFLVWLRYGRSLQVYQLPQQEEDFRRVVRQGGPVYEFEWREDTLRPIRLPGAD